MRKIHLTRDKKTGDWFTKDRHYCIYRGTVGWCISTVDEMGIPDYCFPIAFSDTLNDACDVILDIIHDDCY